MIAPLNSIHSHSTVSLPTFHYYQRADFLSLLQRIFAFNNETSYLAGLSLGSVMWVNTAQYSPVLNYTFRKLYLVAFDIFLLSCILVSTQNYNQPSIHTS